MKVLLAHPGTQHSFHLARQLYRLDFLFRFYTGIAYGDGSWQKSIINLLPNSFQNNISNRLLSGIPDNLIKRNIIVELKAQVRLKMKRGGEQVFFERNKTFQESIPDSAIKSVDVVIGFDTSSWILAKRCKKLRKPFILDISIGHPYEKQKVYEKISKQFPEWSFTLKPKSQFLINLEIREMELADRIVVASTFSKRTLIDHGVDERKIFVNPYGTDPKHFRAEKKMHRHFIKFVFVGLVDARKGIPVLLEAWKKIDKDKAQLTLIGPISTVIESIIRQQWSDVIIAGKITHKDLPGILSKQDVLVFPSYFEGFGLVIPEAMAAELSVITTPSTCGPDILKDGESGYIIPCGDVEQLAERMQRFLNDKNLLQKMQGYALTSVKSFTWSSYGKRWEKIINCKFSY